MIKAAKNLPLIIISIFLVFLIILSQVFQEDFRLKVLNVIAGPLKIAAGVFYTLQDMEGVRSLRFENEILKGRIQNMEMEMLNLQEERLENKRLRELLDFVKTEKRKYIPALIIARDPSELRGAVIIDKGKRDKLEQDMLVISGHGLVGRISDVGWSISRVILITDYDSVFSGIIESTREEGIVVGNGQRYLIMRYLEINNSVQKGDKVITAGLSNAAEKGILIGEVASTEKDFTGLYLNAIIKPAVDVMKIEEVLVVK